MFRLRRRLGLLVFLVCTLGAVATAIAADTVRVVSVDGPMVQVAPPPVDLPPGAILEVKRGEELLGLMQAQQPEAAAKQAAEESSSEVSLVFRIVAGRADRGAEARLPQPIPTRVGYLGSPDAGRVEQQLKILCPGRVRVLQSADGLERSQLDAVVVTAEVPKAPIEAFVAAGGTAIVDLGPYAAWSDRKPETVRSTSDLAVKCVGRSPATRGLAAGQAFEFFGLASDDSTVAKSDEGAEEGTKAVAEQSADAPKFRVCRALPTVADGGKVLLELADGGLPVAVEHVIGHGRLLAIDLLSPNGEPGYDAGSVLHWLLPGNLLARSVRYSRALSTRQSHDEYMQRQEALAARLPDPWCREAVGTDSGGKTIWRFRHGPMDRPQFLYVGAIHAGEWLNPHLLLDFIEYLADPPTDDYRARWLKRHFTLVFIPMLSNSMRQHSFNGCDLNRNFDFRWEDYTKGYGWRADAAMKLRGDRPFSEPEARVVRDHVWNHPVIGHVDMHMHGPQHGAMFIAAHALAETDRRVFDAASALIDQNVRDRFLWKGPSQLIFRRSAFSGRTVPYSSNWVAYQGVWSVSTELVGGPDHSLQEKELGFEGLTAFSCAVGSDFRAGHRAWLGRPRFGFARPGGYKDATALCYEKDGRQTLVLRTNRGHGALLLPISDKGCRLRDAEGNPLEFEVGKGLGRIPMDTSRVFFDCGDATREEIRAALEQATFERADAMTFYVTIDNKKPEFDVTAPEADSYYVFARVRGHAKPNEGWVVSLLDRDGPLRVAVDASDAGNGPRWVRATPISDGSAEPWEHDTLPLAHGKNRLRLAPRASSNDQEPSAPAVDRLYFTNNAGRKPEDKVNAGR